MNELQYAWRPPDGTYIFHPDPKPKKWKIWMGLVGVDKGEIFLSPRIARMGNMEAFLCCGYDNTPVLIHGKDTLLVPAKWLVKEKPQCLDIVLTIIERMASGHNPDMSNADN